MQTTSLVAMGFAPRAGAVTKAWRRPVTTNAATMSIRLTIDLVSMTWLRTEHGEHAVGGGHGSRTAGRRRHDRVAQASADHHGHDEHTHDASSILLA